MTTGLPLSFLNGFSATVLVALLTITIGCSTYQTRVDESRSLLTANPELAIEKLRKLSEEESRDQLAHMLDYAAALQVVGQYGESAKVYLRAEKLAELSDYHSISNVAASLVLSEEMVQYKAEDFERVLIPSLNALNYLQLDQSENAMTQVRRVNEILTKLRIDGNKDFEPSAYAYYIGALLHEQDRDFDNALILYKKAFELAPQFSFLQTDLIRISTLAQRPDELEKFKNQFSEQVVREAVESTSKHHRNGEIVFVYLHGWGPRKQMRPENHRFPRLVSVPDISDTSEASIQTPEGAGVATIKTQTIYSIESVAIRALESDYQRLVLSRATGLAAKAVLSDQIRQKNEALGQLAWVVMNISDRADLRQWSIVPKEIRMARFIVKDGRYDITLGSNGTNSSRSLRVDVKTDRKTFVIWR